MTLNGGEITAIVIGSVVVIVLLLMSLSYFGAKANKKAFEKSTTFNRYRNSLRNMLPSKKQYK